MDSKPTDPHKSETNKESRKSKTESKESRKSKLDQKDAPNKKKKKHSFPASDPSKKRSDESINSQQSLPESDAKSKIAVPEGLEGLKKLDQLFLKMNKDETYPDLRYLIVDSAAKSLFAVHKKDTGQFSWTWHLSLKNPEDEKEYLEFRKPSSCCRASIAVWTTPSEGEGTLLGEMEEKKSCCATKFNLKTTSGKTLLRIKGPSCCPGPCREPEFKILERKSGKKLGKIWKTENALVAQFPKELELSAKTVLIGALFLIDYMFYEGDESSCFCF